MLRTLADSLVTLFALGSCRIELEGTSPVEATRAGGGPPGAEIEIPIEAGGHRVGRRVAAPAQPGETIGDLERSLLRTFAGQLALALEAARLGTEAGRARLDAEANQVRAALFSSVTHDLRTPLSSIKASVTSLLGGDVTFDERAREELLRTILEETDRLNRLVGNLLDLSRMRSGGLVPAKALAPIGEVVESVVRRLRLLLEGRPLRLTIREDLPEVPMDVVQVDQALSNLLENAVKFSPAGSEIGISAVRWQDSVQVRVSDRGPGIPSEERSKVFQPFYRGASDGGQPGTGLGLAIARAVVSVHGGRIWIEGTPAGGTTAVFELPLTAAGERT